MGIESGNTGTQTIKAKVPRLNCIELKGWSLLPNALLPFQIYCAPPNLGITRM